MAFDHPIRAGGVADAETIVRHRHVMFREMGYRDEAVLDKMSAAFRPWVMSKLQSGEYMTWFALRADGSIAAGVGLWIMDWPPHMLDTAARRGNILNVYTDPDSRRLGLARKLMETAVAWCREHGIRSVILHASAEGRPLYESMGFQATNEMRISP